MKDKIMKLVNFKNTSLNNKYAFDAEKQVVVNRNSNKAMTWEASGKVRLTVDGQRKRFTRDEIVANIEVIETKKERKTNKDTIAAKYRSKLAEVLLTGKTKDEAYTEMNKWASDKIATQRDRWVYFVRSFDKVAANLSKYK